MSTNESLERASALLAQVEALRERLDSTDDAGRLVNGILGRIVREKAA